jgi:hypothetical protein
MRMVRLQGREAGPTDTVWLGVSTLEPGGGMTSKRFEKIYVVLAGEIVVSGDEREVRLGLWDSCRFGPLESRQIRNESDRQASVLLVMPLQPNPPTQARSQ